MLPLLQAEEIKHSVTEYLKATFNFQDKDLEQALSDFLFDRRNGMFKGAYLQVRLPFEKVNDSDSVEKVIHVRPNFAVYRHQFEAFKRLSTRNGNEPEPVILTTGTGSGKTESFLYPLLDYCYQHRDTPGIKAIILYPMNALATDQAKRLAKTIFTHKDEEGNTILKGKIRAGLFIGEGRDKNKNRSNRMEKERVIEDRDTIIQSPPDILLTNFKMLDFALMRGDFHNLWTYNFKDPDLLKFLVLDELHTYDGAKGSDVANLIRRLKLKLSMLPQQIVPVGTSATMGGGEEGKNELVKFFGEVFGIRVNKHAVIEEHRLLPEDFFEENLLTPEIELSDLHQLDFKEQDDYDLYIKRQLNFWGYEGIENTALPAELIKNEWLYQLLIISKGNVKTIDEVTKKWAHKIGLETFLNNQELTKLLGSLLALVSYAKEKSGDKLFPFLYLQITYWLRSLNRVLLKVQASPMFEWESERNPADPVLALPPYFCRECGSSGWVAIKKENNDTLEDDLTRTRQLFMADRQNKNVYFLSSLEHKTYKEVFAEDYQYTGMAIEGYIDPQSLAILDKRENGDQFKVFGVRVQNDDRIQKICPHCNSLDTLALIGTGIPTIESIATAQVLATATDSSDDQNRKLLAFTNGVQDAAHQAGFIENRNYRFGMRHAIQAVLKQTNGKISLPELYVKFVEYWKENTASESKYPIEAYYYKFLPPDCDARINLLDYKNKSYHYTHEFDHEFSNRMSWEMWSEFSYNATIGRTLEKSAASAIGFDMDKMEAVYSQMQYWFTSNALAERIDKNGFLLFLNGFLHRLRQRGGMHHTYLNKYRTERTSYYLITQNVNKHFFLMKNFGKFTRLPKFITLERGPHTAAFDVIQIERSHNWYSTYLLKTFPLIQGSEIELINDFYKQLLEYLDSNELLDKKVAAGVVNYGIPQMSLAITTDVKQFCCDVCKHELNVGVENEKITEGMSCLQYRCPGHYKTQESAKFDYYRMVYNRGRSLRIFANDHTGLIDRDKREALEVDFKERPSYKSTNVLVATSTLEMGIDIGDLNITFNSSLPPETANYLQRVGRAGRSSGTSLILNMAGRLQHDLYYFRDPMEMMNGEVRTPACYLRAKDILRRHFMAYCFDCWTTLDPQMHRIPFMIRLLRIKSYPEGDNRFIFNQIVSFIRKNGEQLYEAFITYFKDAYEEDSTVFEELKQSLISETFTAPLAELHKRLRTEIEHYEVKRKDVIKQLKKLPTTSPDAILLKKESRALSGAISNIFKRRTVEYLTNIGILPNYAFPETGVELNAQIIKKQEKDGNVTFKSEEFGELVRPASGALTELAPSNVFYSQGHMLHMDGITILSREEYEVYRFCSNCDEMQLNVSVPENQMGCPKCGHNSWSSSSNRKTIVKLKSVLSVNDSEKSKITDSKDDRERKFYQKSIHIKTIPSTSKGARVLKRIPFGIEFFSKTKYTEINTGVREEGFFGTNEIEINGTKYPEVGFVVCKTCGKTAERKYTQYEIDNRRKSYHFGYCSNKKEVYKNRPDEHFEEIYLYREFYTESIKILLPVQDFRSEEKVSIFKAGLYLGLKNYYKGHPDHVRIQEYDEFNKETRRKDRFLIMFETIPGGTGYLSKLFNTEEFTKLLIQAYDKIRFCNCKDEGKDGCYHCIYTYGNQYERETLSRYEAETLFQNIIDKTGEWNIVSSLQGINGFANNEESDLEHKFIDLLSKTYKNNLKEVSDTGVKKYQLVLGEDGNELVYEIWPQNLGNHLKGVEFTTTPDFVFTCVGGKQNEKPLSFEEIHDIKDVAVYLDGYAFHASKDHPRLPSDIRIRNAIVEAEKYHLWVFTWEDIVNHGQEKRADEFDKNSNPDIIRKMMLGHPIYRDIEGKDIVNTNSFVRFLFMLQIPLRIITLKEWASLLLFSHQADLLGHCFTSESVDEFIQLRKVEENKKMTRSPNYYAYADKLIFKNELSLSTFIHPQTFKIKGFSFLDSMLPFWDKENWQMFWPVYNLTQFFGIITYDSAQESNSQEKEGSDKAWILDNFDDTFHEIVQQLITSNIDFNKDADFDLVQNGEIIASAALGSVQKKFFIEAYDDDRATFLKEGYTEYTLENFDIKKLT